MTKRWIVTAIGKDRPGIVAAVTKILYQVGCNLEDSAMTRLEGEFAIMLIFSAPAKVTEERLRQAFKPLEREKLAVYLKTLGAGETAAPARRGRPYIISVYGADQPGIVYKISEMAAAQQINITDVETHRSPGKGTHALYLMLLEVEVPPRVSEESLEHRLQQLGKTLGVEVSLQSAEPDVL